MTDMDLEPLEEILSDVDLKEKEFHGIVREITILCLISIILYIGSFAFLNLLRYVVTMLFYKTKSFKFWQFDEESYKRES